MNASSPSIGHPHEEAHATPTPSPASTPRTRPPHPAWPALSLGLVLLLAGCAQPVPAFEVLPPATGGPTPSPALPNPATTAAPPEATPAPSPAPLPPPLIEEPTTTNGVPLAWLRPSTNLFRLGPGDVLEVELLSEPSPRSTVFLGPDGKIYYSFLPGLFVWGLTLEETRELIAQELAAFVKSKPEVGVSLRSVGSRQIWVLGTVTNPGVYPLPTPMTILEAIALAGGTVTPAGVNSGVLDLARSFVMRQGQMIQVDLHSLLARGDMSQNIYLEPDDFIYLRSAITRNIYVMGAVGRPSILPFVDDLTALTAISQSGGPVPYAQRSKVVIVRGSLSKPITLELNYSAIAKGKEPDLRLQPGDIVYVPMSPYARVGQLVESIVQNYVRTTAINEGYRAAGGTGNITPTLPAPTP